MSFVTILLGVGVVFFLFFMLAVTSSLFSKK